MRQAPGRRYGEAMRPLRDYLPDGARLVSADHPGRSATSLALCEDCAAVFRIGDCLVHEARDDGGSVQIRLLCPQDGCASARLAPLD